MTTQHVAQLFCDCGTLQSSSNLSGSIKIYWEEWAINVMCYWPTVYIWFLNVFSHSFFFLMIGLIWLYFGKEVTLPFTVNDTWTLLKQSYLKLFLFSLIFLITVDPHVSIYINFCMLNWSNFYADDFFASAGKIAIVYNFYYQRVNNL